MQDINDALEYISSLRAALTGVTDSFEHLLEEGKFPNKGRSQDDKESAENWWSDSYQSIKKARDTLKEYPSPSLPIHSAAKWRDQIQYSSNVPILRRRHGLPDADLAAIGEVRKAVETAAKLADSKEPHTEGTAARHAFLTLQNLLMGQGMELLDNAEKYIREGR